MISVSLQVHPTEILIQILSFNPPQLTGPDRRSKLSLLGVCRLFHSRLTPRFYDTLHLLSVRRWAGFADRFEMGGLVDWSRMVKKLRIRQMEQIVFGDLPADRFLAAVRRLGDTFTLAIEEIEIESCSFRAFQVGHRFAAALLQLLQTAQVVSLAAGSVAPSALSSRPNSPSPPSDCPSQKPFKDLPKSPGSTASNPPENVVSCQAKRTGPHLPYIVVGRPHLILD